MKPFLKATLILLLAFGLVVTEGCDRYPSASTRDSDSQTDWMIRKIRSQGRLVAVTSQNSVNYFVSNGQPLGFQYELLRSFASHLGVELEVIVINNLSKTFEYLQKGKCDIIAMNLTVTSERSKTVSFTEPIAQTRQVLVQRKPEQWTAMSTPEIEKSLIRNQIDLAGKKIFVEKNSSFSKRLRSLSDEIGKPIRVIELDDYDSEELITLVSKGQINYTVVDENLGTANGSFYPNIDMATPISFSQNLAWAVRREDHGLLSIINAWLRDYKKSMSFQYTWKQYFGSGKNSNLARETYHKSRKGKISIFDEIIQKHGKLLGWDWTLLASLIYQESRFHPNVVSPGGAMGLMQLAPVTARRFKVKTWSTPEENIRAGVRHLRELQQSLSFIPDPIERKKFVLASYNVGLGHIMDARKLAGKNGKDPMIWDGNVAEFLKMKALEPYSEDPDLRFGKIRKEKAEITLRFVDEIFERWRIYKGIVATK